MDESEQEQAKMEELEKFRRYRRTRDPTLREHLITENMGLAEKLARRFTGYGEPLDDLIQESYIGLIKAVDQFNPDRGTQFITYATHVITGHIRHYLRDLGKLIKEPAWMQEARQKVNRASEELFAKTGKMPAAEEIARHTGIKLSTVRHILSTKEVFQVESLDASYEAEDGEAQTADLERLQVEQQESQRIPFEDQIALKDAIGKLRQIERTVIYYFFYQEYSKTEIAKMLGISANYVGYLLKKGLARLRELLSPPDVDALSRLLHEQRQRTTAYEAQLRVLKRTEDVTQFLTKSFFIERLAEDVRRAKRYKHPLSVAFVLCPLFAGLSRRLSRTQFEELLSAFASEVRKSLREVDYLAQLSDFEFAVALPHTERSAKVALNRIRRRLEEANLPPLQSGQRLTVSWGLALFPEDGQSAEELLEAARLEAHAAPPA